MGEFTRIPIHDVEVATKRMSVLPQDKAVPAWESHQEGLIGFRSEKPKQPIVLYARSPDDNAVRHGLYGANLLVRAAWNAWNEHYPLRLNVNSIWLTILNQFGTYVSLHHEELRGKFVRHDGKMKLEATVPPFSNPNEVDWESQLFARMADLIEKNTEPGLRDALRVDFSNSLPIDGVCGDIALMDVCGSYFFFFSCTMCGIPWVDLVGSHDDWVRMREKIAYLERFALPGDVDHFGSWVDNLKRVADKFVEAVEGRPDVHFFGSIVSLKEASGEGPKVSGWIMDLFLYDNEKKPNWKARSWRAAEVARRLGKEQLKRPWDGFEGQGIDEFPSGIAKVPITLRRLENGTQERLELIGGLMTMVQHEDMSLDVRSGWGLLMKGSEPISERPSWL